MTVFGEEPVTLGDVNRMDARAFVSFFGDVAERSPWVAERAALARPFASREAMVEAFGDAVRAAPEKRQLALLRAHPDLAGKAARAGNLTDDSAREQSGAGLDALTGDELSRFAALNERYRKEFGIPFILAVKGAGKRRILEAFERRLRNPLEAELANALEQVCRIFRFRIESRVEP